MKASISGVGSPIWLRVGARVHFVDGWEGETAFLQVDGAYAWVDTARAHPNGLNLAGGPQPDARFGVPVDAVVAHTAPSVLLEIGSTLDEHACDESYGVDDVQVVAQLAGEMRQEAQARADGVEDIESMPAAHSTPSGRRLPVGKFASQPGAS